MIKSVAEMLSLFAAEERKKMDAYNITHGPTIGAMYEGLSRKILKQAIPEELGLRVVEGFISFGNKISGQIDCMLVKGDGEEIPHTDTYKWPVKDVIAVFEVKKRLSAEELVDSYFHLRQVHQLYAEYVESREAQGEKVNLQRVNRIFATMTGVIAPPYNRVAELDFDKEMIYHTLVMEFLSPIRIVVGYHGWKREQTLRNHIVAMLEDRMNQSRGLGVGSFPQLIVGGQFSLIKANGFPYVTGLLDGMWPFLLSGRVNPALLMLELIWSRLDDLYELGDLWDDDLAQEHLNPCLLARAVRQGDIVGWAYEFKDLSEETLASTEMDQDWEPVPLTVAQSVIMHYLCRDGEVNVEEPRFIEFVAKEGKTVEQFVAELIGTHLVARDGNRLCLTTIHCGIVQAPNGDIFAGEDNTGLLTKWAEKQIGKPISQWNILVIRLSYSTWRR